MRRLFHRTTALIALCSITACGSQEQESSLGASKQAVTGRSEVSRPHEWLRGRRSNTATIAPTGCSSEAQCNTGAACIRGACTICSTHDDCESKVCDRYWLPIGMSDAGGYCYPTGAVVYVDNRSSTCAQGNGTLQQPVCEIQDVIPYYSGNKLAIRVAPGSYQPFDAGGRTMLLYGAPGATRLEYTGSDPVHLFRLDLPQARVLLDGFVFSRYGFYSVATLHIRRSEIRGSASPDDAQFAVYSMGSSEFSSEGNLVIGNKAGFHMGERTLFRVANTLIADSFGGPAIAADGNTRGRILFNAFLTNAGSSSYLGAGGITNISPYVWIEDSVLYGNGLAPTEQTQILAPSAPQQVVRTVVGARDATRLLGTIHIDPVYNGYHIDVDAANNKSCCFDKGDPYPRASSIMWDAFGNYRKPHSSDIGAEDRLHLR